MDTTSHELELASIEAARERITSRIARTPMLQSSTAARWTEAAVRGQFGKEIRLAGGRLYLKADHLQKTGSFKVRGVLNKISRLSPEQKAAGLRQLQEELQDTIKTALGDRAYRYFQRWENSHWLQN